MLDGMRYAVANYHRIILVDIFQAFHIFQREIGAFVCVFFVVGEFSIRFLFCIERKHVRPCKRQTHQRYLFGFFAIRRRKVCCATILVLVSSEHTNYSCDWTVKQGDYLIVYASHSFHWLNAASTHSSFKSTSNRYVCQAEINSCCCCSLYEWEKYDLKSTLHKSFKCEDFHAFIHKSIKLWRIYQSCVICEWLIRLLGWVQLLFRRIKQLKRITVWEYEILFWNFIDFWRTTCIYVDVATKKQITLDQKLWLPVSSQIY